MANSKQKDNILSQIKTDSFEYKKSLHAEAIEALDVDGLIDITRTKDGTCVDLTSKGKAFINSGGYAIAEKEKAKEKRNKQLSKALKWIISIIVAAVIGAIVEGLINPL